ncbi:MAG: (2Fe-2S)-binding protein [candidate division WOR-3 bacterium]
MRRPSKRTPTFELRAPGLRPARRRAAEHSAACTSSLASRKDQGRIVQHPIIRFERGAAVRFFFEGKPVIGYTGETIAAALVANGIRVFRHTEKMNRPRGFFCAVGKCSSCLMVVDGRPNTMVCMEPVRPDIRVERQVGRGRLL